MGLFVGKTHGNEENGRKDHGDHGDQNNFSEHTQSLCIAVIFMRGGRFSAFLRPYGRKNVLFYTFCDKKEIAKDGGVYMKNTGRKRRRKRRYIFV